MRELNVKTLKLNDRLTVISIDESSTILDIERRCYYNLNDTADFLVQHMRIEQNIESLLSETLFEFDVEEETARHDIENFIVDLVKKGLIYTTDGTINHARSIGVRRGIKPYQSPVLEYQKELIVASAQAAPTPH